MKFPPKAILTVTQAVVSAKAGLDSPALLFRSFHSRRRALASEESPDHVRLSSSLALLSQTLRVIWSPFVFICQSGLLLGKCGVSCLFPTIKAASLKLIVFDLQRSLTEVTRESPRWLLFFPAVKAPNECNNCLNRLERRREKNLLHNSA